MAASGNGNTDVTRYDFRLHASAGGGDVGHIDGITEGALIYLSNQDCEEYLQ